MTTPSFALFDTAIGLCGLAWGAQGILGVQLPEANEADTRARILIRFPDARERAPSREAKSAIAGITALVAGKRGDLGAVPLDMTGVPEFHRRVYEAARAIPPGRTLSYGEIAARIGAKGAARAVGTALARNPFAILVPCHRVLGASGKLGGFSAHGGVETKRRLLDIEAAGSNTQAAELCGAASV